MMILKSELLTTATRTQKQNNGHSENEQYRLGPMAESHLLRVSIKIKELKSV